MFSPEQDKLVVNHAEAPGCLYTLSHPTEEIAAGELLELVDFQNSALGIGSHIALGTRVFKEAIMAVRSASSDSTHIDNDGPYKDPFLHVYRLPGSPKGMTVWTTPNVHLRLADFYLGVQALKDYYDDLTDEERLVVFAEKGRLVVHDVLYDDQVQELA